MPKIPTFISEARPTAEVGSVKSNIQVPLSQTLAGALSPLTDLVVKKAVQEKDITNKTQALKLENEYNIAMQQVTEEIITNPNYGDNQETSQTYYQEQAKKNREKFGSQANNDFTKTMFINNSLLLDQKFSNRLSKDVSKNIVLNLDEQVNIKLNNILTNAFLPSNSEFNREVVIRDIENLYYSSYYGKVPTYLYNKLINNIPNEVYGFEITKGLSSNPRETYTKLLDSKSYPKLDYTLRKEFINQGKLILTGPVKKELENVIFGTKFEGRVGKEDVVKLNFAKSILKIEEFNEFQTRYDLAKLNASDVREILKAPKSDIQDIIERNKYTENDYVGEVDLITQAKLLQGLQQAATYRNEQMALDAVGFITATRPEIKKLKDDFINSGTDRDAQIQNRQIYNDAIINEQTRMGVKSFLLRVTDKTEINGIKNTLLSSSESAEEKIQYISMLKALYGSDNYSLVRNHLQDEKLPDALLLAMSTDNIELTKNLFSSSTLVDLKKLAIKEGITITDVEEDITKKTEDFAQVIYSQGEGSTSKAAFVLSIREGLLKAVLVREKDGNTSLDAAVTSVTDDFLGDYVIDSSLTWMMPKYMGVGKNIVRVPTAAAQNKAEAIIIGVKDDLPGNVLDEFMGKDGYMHYAKTLGIKNLTEEEVKKKVTFNIRNYPVWLNNKDITGNVLHADFSNGLQPVINSKGQRVEYYFADLPNQDPDIKSTDSVFPYTNTELPLIPYTPAYGEIDLDDFTTDNNIYPENNKTEILPDNKKRTSVSKEEYDKQLIGIENQRVDSLQFGTDGRYVNNNFNVVEAKKLEDNFNNDKANIELFKSFESDGDITKTSIPTQVSYTKKDNDGNIVKDKKGNAIEIKENFSTIGDGHRITKKEEESGMIYDHVFKDKNGVIIPLEQWQINDIFKRDVKKAINLVNDLGKKSTINLNKINQNAYNILVQMAFQMGSNAKEKTGLAEFEKVLKSVNAGNYTLASQHMLYNFKSKNYEDISGKKTHTKWHKQTGIRAKKLSQLMNEIPDKIPDNKS